MLHAIEVGISVVGETVSVPYRIADGLGGWWRTSGPLQARCTRLVTRHESSCCRSALYPGSSRDTSASMAARYNGRSSMDTAYFGDPFSCLFRVLAQVDVALRRVLVSMQSGRGSTGTRPPPG